MRFCRWICLYRASRQANLIGSLAGFAILYTALLIVEYWLMVRYAKLGPSSLGTGRYFFERKA